MLLKELYQALRKFLKETDGSIMLVTIGLVILILILTSAAMHWTANLVLNQRRYNVSDLQKMEPYNANLIMKAQIRQRLIENNTNLFDSASISELENNLTRDPALQFTGATNIGFYVVAGSVQIPTWSNWMTTNTSAPYFNNFSTEMTPRPDDPLFSLWHISYPQEGATNFDIAYQLYYWDGGREKTNALDTALADRLPNLTNASYYFTNAIHIRELPSSQLQVLAVDQFDTTRMNGRIALRTAGGMAFFPYGVIQGKNNYLATLDLNSDTNNPTCVVTTELITKAGEESQTFNYDQNKFVLRPNLGTSWMLDPYAIPEGSESSFMVYQNQRFYEKSQHIIFDGQQVWCDQVDGGGASILAPFPGVTVDRKFIYPAGYTFNNGTVLSSPLERDFGMKRVIIDMRALQANKVNGQYSYYVDCITPMAKQRGVVIVGADNVLMNLASILTNGSLRLEGSQSVAPMITGTSYGGVVFTGAFADGSGNPIHTAAWNAYIINTVRPPTTIASGSGSPVDLGSQGCNFDTVQVKGQTGTGGVDIGFGNESGWACYFNLSNSGAQAYVVINGAPQPMGSLLPLAASNIDFEVTYKRALNVLSINSHSVGSTAPWQVEQDVPLSSIIPRVEATLAMWGGGSHSVIARASGSAFYGEHFISSVTITGGLAVGQFITGNLRLDVIPSSNPNQFFVYGSVPPVVPMAASDRFLLFDP